jgi:parallel beta-helix repeat protein
VPRYLCAIVLLAVLGRGIAADYVVAPSPTGEEGGSGSSDHPFTTVHQAAAKAGSGDTIWIARGGTYREPNGLEFHSGVTVKAAGAASAPPPVLTTSIVLSTFKPWAKNPKVLTVPSDKRVLECYVDGHFLLMARYPKQGWLRAQKGSTPDLILAPERAKEPGAAAERWKGAQVRWRRWSWWWETRPITDDDGKFHDGFTGDGSAFYVDDCLALLDAPGEWCYDQASATLYIYPPASADAKKPLVEVVVDTTGFGCGGATVEGIGFARIAGKAVKIGKPAMISNCTFQDIGEDAISSAWDCGGSHITGCSFTDIRNAGIYWLENPGGPGGTLIENNRFERIGMVFGYGGSGSWRGVGVIVNKGKAVTVKGNRFIDIGNNGVILGAPGVIVERNVFVRCMGSLNDGAGIYACANASIIRDNIVLDTVGNLDTSHWWFPLGHGIWTEFLSDFKDQVITGNTVFGCGGHGIFLTNNYHCQVKDNTLMGNRLSALHISGKNGKAQDNQFIDNILVALDPARRLSFPENIPANWKGNDYARCLDAGDEADFGHMSGTTLIASPGLTLISQKGKHIDDPAAWKAADSWADPAPHVERAASLLLINDTDVPHDFPAPAGGWHQLDGKAVAKALTVAPFRSVVVIRTGDGTGLPPYVMASGIDYRAPTPGPAKDAKDKGLKHPAPSSSVPAPGATTPATPAMTPGSTTH